MTRLMSDPGSPGRLLKLSEEAIVAAVEESRVLVPEINLASPAGTTQLVIDGTPQELANRLLLRHHAKRGVGSNAEQVAIAGRAARLPLHSRDQVLDLRVASPIAPDGIAR